MSTYARPLRALLPLGLAACLFASCAPEAPPTAQKSSVAAVTAPPTVAPDAYPRPLATALPTPPLAEPIAGLAAGVQVQLASAAELTLRDGATRYHLVPVTAVASAGADGAGRTVDVVLVRSDAGGSRQVLSLAQRLGVAVKGIGGDLSSGEVVVETAKGRWLLRFELAKAATRPAGVDVALALPLAGVDIPLQPFATSVRWLDWTGDGIADPLLVYDPGDAPASAAIYATARSDDAADGTVKGRLAAIIDASDVLIDLDGDGVAELVSPDGGGGWRSRRWNGERFVPGEPVAALHTVPTAVVAADLPALPANLVFGRDGVLYVWPAGGGVLATLTEPAAGELGPRSSSLTHGGTDRIAYLETRASEPGGKRSDTSDLIVQDLATRERRVVRRLPEQADASQLGLSGDGNWLTYFEEDCSEPVAQMTGPLPAPTIASGCRGTWFVVAAETDAAPRVLAACTVHEERETSVGCDHSLAAPIGNRLAYGDDDGLWVVDVPDGTPRQLTDATSDSGGTSVGESDDGVAALQSPESWSPDGRWLMTNGPSGNSEGGVLRLWDMTMLQPAGTIGFRYSRRTDEGWNLAGSGASSPLVEADVGYPNRVMLRSLGSTEELTTTELLPLLATSDPAHPSDPSGLPELGWSPGYEIMPFGPIVTPAGTLVFGVQHGSERRFLGNALLEATLPAPGSPNPLATGLHPIVSLPAVTRDEHGNCCQERLGTIEWSPGGAAWLFTGRRAPSADDPYGMRTEVWVGLADGSTVWDASA
ncbi:MAG: hypothetical protein ABI780_15010, partial [Ardenticatenales bacterium]